MKSISIIYAYRNREIQRIRFSMESLQLQSSQNFEVIFVDYGSKKEITVELRKLLSDYKFVKYFYLPVENLLWNKSKALNYGILKSTSEYVFIADVDLIFHPGATLRLEKLKKPKIFQLFKLGYLGKKESEKLKNRYSFEQLKPARFGDVNGMILTSKKALMEVNGFDEFFHFYGAEDEDLFSRLESTGYNRRKSEEHLFYHNWHHSFSGSKDKILTKNPRLKNIMRINQRHFQRNRERGVVKPLRQEGMGRFVAGEEAKLLQEPTRHYSIPNILAQVEHFLREELVSHQGEVISVLFFEDPYYLSLKHRIKKYLGKQTQAFCSMKDVNDLVLKEILFNYREQNYSFEIQEDLKKIKFKIHLQFE